MRFRKAESADLADLSALAEQTFRAAFAEFNTETDMSEHCAAHFGISAFAEILADSRKPIVLAEQDQHLAAYAQVHVGESWASVPAAKPAELHRFYVLDTWHGKGLASEFLRHIAEDCRQSGTDVLWLGVWERNSRAINFYAKNGFAIVGNKEFLLGQDRQRDLVMALDLRKD